MRQAPLLQQKSAWQTNSLYHLKRPMDIREYLLQYHVGDSKCRKHTDRPPDTVLNLVKRIVALIFGHNNSSVLSLTLWDSEVTNAAEGSRSPKALKMGCGRRVFLLGDTMCERSLFCRLTNLYSFNSQSSRLSRHFPSSQSHSA